MIGPIQQITIHHAANQCEIPMDSPAPEKKIFGASVFWTKRSGALGGEQAMIEYGRLAADTVTVLLSDASKVTLKKSEIESQVASLISVMPERLLDPLSLEEISDLMAFMESEPK